VNHHPVFPALEQRIQQLNTASISEDRKEILMPLVKYLKEKRTQEEAIRLNFICTHNSRRSHLSQIWAQAMASYFGIKDVYTYSGGTEATAMFPKVAETLTKQGFEIHKIAVTENPVYAVKYAANAHPIICFSKTYDHSFNPSSGFGAIMTCDSANEACPMVIGAEERFPITYKDPKAFDNTPQQDEKYLERSEQIATELYWVFQQVVG